MIARDFGPAAIAAATAEGGATFEARTTILFRPADGYAVGIGGAILPDTASGERIVRTARLEADEYGTAFAGTWLADGKVHVDAVQYVTDRGRAIALGLDHGQRAIFDFASSEEVQL